jgi:hypothetical protein
MKNYSFSPRRLIQIWLFMTIAWASSGCLLRADSAPTTNAAPAAGASAVSKPVANTATNDKALNIDEDDDKGHSFQLKIGGDDDKHQDSVLENLSYVLIPLTGIVATFATPVLIVFFVCYFKYRRRQDTLAMAREYLNKGMPVPPELLDPSLGSDDYMGLKSAGLKNFMSRPRSDLRKGFKLAFIGLGVTLAMYLSSPHSTYWAWGLIPMVMGIGFIFSSWAESRIGNSSQDGEMTPPPTRDKPF